MAYLPDSCQAARTEDPGSGAEDDKLSLPLTPRETAELAAVFCLLWFIANYTLSVSLEYTSVASATILSSMSGEYPRLRAQPCSNISHHLQVSLLWE